MDLLTQLLNLPGIVVESLRETETDLMLEVEAWTDKATAHVAVAVVLIYIKIMVIVRDLPISNRQVRLKVNRRQFKCKTCTKPLVRT